MALIKEVKGFYWFEQRRVFTIVSDVRQHRFLFLPFDFDRANCLS